MYDGSWSERRSAAVFRISYSALLLAALDGGRRFAEKNPENSFLVPFLAAALPAAQFVHIIRDGRDAAVSHAEQPWLAAASAGTASVGPARQAFGARTRGGGWKPDRRDEFAAVSDIVRSAWCWRRFTEAALAGLAGLPGGRMLELRYESVVTRPRRARPSHWPAFSVPRPPGSQALRAGLAQAKTSSVGRWRDVLDEPEIAEVERRDRAAALPARVHLRPRPPATAGAVSRSAGGQA